jgi:UDP-N-acetylmuramoyl-L-alanyl-D-glutamate--2,6-diaminopimelate ligase
MPIITFLNKQKALIAHPSRKIRVIGITGSRGKTSVTEMLYHLLKSSGGRVGYLSSLGYSADMENVEHDLNADSITSKELYNLLNRMVENNLSYAVIELTTDNLKKGKYEGVVIDSAIITNIKGDNYSGFKDFSEVLKYKLNFINKIRNGGLLILNDQEPDVMSWLQNQNDAIEQDIYIYPVNISEANILNESIAEGLKANIGEKEISIKSPVAYNLINSLQALKMAESYKPDPKLHTHVETYQNPKGRMELVANEPIQVVIDSAYTPLMLEDALSELTRLKAPDSRIITVFGAAGRRDPERRRMGLVSMKYSYLTILTAEDPKNEKVYDINNEIWKHTEEYGGVILDRFEGHEEYELSHKDNLLLRMQRVKANGDHPFITFDADDYTSRMDAIHFAINFAKPGDIVYITGKGAENTLAFDGIEYEWSDHEAARVALKLGEPILEQLV